MAAAAARARNQRLPPEVNRGSAKETRGTAYVVYDDIYDAKVACDHLSGFNVANRYLIVLYYRPGSMNKKVGTKEQEEQLRKMQAKYGVDGEQHAKQSKQK
ncbi:hypothetical protein CEUSTIGMA_g8136.t1 [Chlamydomonas eustigma]|uniref:RRM domain-containing protein n=1 Tax=Chlamydomonas eustigma TaxID=1157962 RepID=A0A250XCA0_9CHLO|nr:hypothetical protein CEUSTIGMA_g8136.t1 [Chlamydomonas eustigma]|eukprot:GAX80701.1 hypothetical protein CEUSTIGMA_g8136.t1 [Chlamydomonas eustigma]